jgi:hypothetical protein
LGRTPQIRLTKNDRKEYARLVKNAKAKIARTIKEKGTQVVMEVTNDQGETSYQSVDVRNLISIPSIEEFTDRKAFNKLKQDLSSFTNRNNQRFRFIQNEHGVVSTKATINAIEKNNKKAIRLAEKAQSKALKLPFIQGRQEVGTVLERTVMGKKNNTGIIVPLKFNFDSIKFKDQLIVKGKNSLKQADPNRFDKRAENAKNVLADTIERTFNGWADDIADKVRNLPTDVFDMMYQMFEEFQFENWNVSPKDGEEGYDGRFYDPSDEMRNLTQINYYLDLYYEGRLAEKFPGVDLKDF